LRVASARWFYNHNAAFTLIEIVLALIGIALAIVSIALTDRGGAWLRRVFRSRREQPKDNAVMLIPTRGTPRPSSAQRWHTGYDGSLDRRRR
jgi:hypothetical protein